MTMLPLSTIYTRPVTVNPPLSGPVDVPLVPARNVRLVSLLALDLSSHRLRTAQFSHSYRELRRWRWSPRNQTGAMTIFYHS